MKIANSKKRLATQRGFSFVELQVAMVVAAVFMIIIGTVSGIGHRSYNKLREKSQIYSDLGYALKLIRNKVRNAETNLSIDYSPGDSRWVAKQVLVVDGGGFGIFRDSGSGEKHFVFVPDLDDLSIRETIFAIQDDGVDQYNIGFRKVNNSIKVTGNNGIKGNIKFELPDVSILRRTS